jgi:hypothetical protein
MARYDIKIARWIGLILCPVLAWATPIQAQEDEERWYQIELILFKPLGGQDPKESEKWPEIAGIHLPEDLVELTEEAPEPAKDEAGIDRPEPQAPVPTWQPQAGSEPKPSPEKAMTPGPVPYVILGEKEYQLNDILGSLKRSSRFAPLLHLAWRQITVDEAHTKPVLLYTGMTDPLPPSAYVPEAEQEASEDTAEQTGESGALAPPLVPATEEDTKIGPENPELVGTVRLSVSRYLHLEADLVYRTAVAQAMAKPVPDFDLWYDRPYATLHEPQGPAYTLETWKAVQGFRMFESRRMRSKELHYLDNPFFGLVVLVTPYEPPQPEEKEPKETPATEIRTLD